MAAEQGVLALVRVALADLEAAHDRAVAAINSDPDRNAALKAIGEVLAYLRRLDEADMELRTHIAGQIWEAEKLSLAALADRIGVSKARADQLIRNVKKQRAGGNADG